MQTILKTTVSRLIPKSYLEDLIQLREEMTMSYWKIGDITNAIITMSVANKMPIEKMKVYQAVGSVVGKADRSVRLYSYLASFYPPDIRKLYEVLPYSHFVVACQYKGGSEWEEVLNKALDFMDEFGLPPSVERLSFLAKGSPIKFLPEELPEITGCETSQINQSVVDEAREIISRPNYDLEIDMIIHRLPILVEKLHTSGEQKYIRCAELLAQIYTLSKEVENIINGRQIEVQGSYNE